MTETKERVIVALKDMLVTTRYPKVTVNELCLRARISRNTFYANFEDKDDVIRLVFESSVLPVSYTHLDVYKRQVWW